MMRMPIAFVFALVMGACSFGGSGNGGGGGGGGGGGVDAAIPVCGDGTCAASEVNSCSQDCGGGGGGGAVCGNGQCESTKGESAASCPSDCGGGGGAVCGTGTCEATESNTSCPSDCPTGGGGNLDCNDQNVQLACVTCLLTNQCTGVDPTSCATCLGGMGSGGGSALGCVGGLPNGVCDPGEDANNCPFDCM